MKTLCRLLVFLSLLTPALPAAAGVGVWTPLGPDGGSVWALAVDPDDADVVYAGTPTGIFKSTDAGATWTPASKGLGPTGVLVRTLVATPGAVYAGTDANGVYKSTDDGATWVPASKGLPPPEYAVPNVGVLLADPRFPNRIWAAAGRSVFLTTNGGLTWQERGRGLPKDTEGRGLALTPDGKTLYVANARAVFKTTNQGKKWTRVSIGLPAGGLTDMVVNPAAPANVFVAAPIGLWKTTNGGARWTRVAPNLFDGAVPALAWQGTRLLASVDSDTKRGIYYSDDQGETWTAAAQGPSDPRVLELAAGPDLVYAGTFGYIEIGGVFRSLDHGQTWDLSIAGFIGQEARSVAVDLSDSDVLYAGVELLGIFKSTDRGATWKQLDLGLGPSTAVRIDAILVDPSDPSIVYAGSGFPGGIFRSLDAGASWEEIDAEHGPQIEALAIDPQTPGTVWAAGFLSLYRSEDHGETWERLPVPNGGDFWTRALAVDPHDPNVLWAGGSTGLRGVPYLLLFRSADGGQTWQRRESGLGGNAVLSLAIAPGSSDFLLAGTPTGIYRTTSAGLPWHSLPVFVTDANAIVAAGPTTFYAHFLGFGVYRTADGGTTWTPARRGLAPVPVNRLAVDPGDPRQLYAGSRTRGVFTYTEPTP